jgi:UDP-glucose 4-epimerase
MKILITGSSGFVGRHLVNKLSRKYKIVGFDLKNGQNILNERLLLKKLKGVDSVVHLAAFISASESWEKPKEYFENNTLGTLSVIRQCIEAKVKRLIIFSSAAVKARPLTPYSVSKIAAEEIVGLYKNKIKVTIVRPENIYGPGQKESYGYVIHNFIRAIKKRRPIHIYGDGLQVRDFIYIDDVVSVVDKLIISRSASGLISLGTGKGTNIKTLAKIIAKVVNRKTSVIFEPPKVEPRKSIADIKTLRSLKINAKKFTNLENGIRRLICLEYSK